MKTHKIITNSLILFLLILICSRVWADEGEISSLKEQILALEEQKGNFEAEKQSLISEGDELSQKIEELKMQSKSGLGIIGRYKLSRNLRKAQALSEKIQALEKNIYEIDNQLKDKGIQLEKEYEHQIAILLEELNGTGGDAEKADIVKKLQEYRDAKEQLAKLDKEEIEHLDIMEIEIKEYDGSQEIREKADLLSDFAKKTENNIQSLTERIEKLERELKTRNKLSEFAEEISFFGDRVSKEELVSDSGEDTDEILIESTNEINDKADISYSDGTPETIEIDAAEPRTTTEQPPAEPERIVMERNGISADISSAPLDQIEELIKLIEKRKKDMEKEFSMLSEKAKSFYEKADEIEESETKSGERK